MKCESVQKKLLLRQTGELSPMGRFGLRRHLLACAGCRQFEQDLDRLTALARAPAIAPDVSVPVLDAIRREARKESSRSDEIRLRPSPGPLRLRFGPALAYAALCLALIAGVWIALRPAPPAAPVARAQATPAVPGADWETAAIDTQIQDLSDRLDVARSDDELTAMNGNESDDVDSMARELLTLEGQKI